MLSERRETNGVSCRVASAYGFGVASGHDAGRVVPEFHRWNWGSGEANVVGVHGTGFREGIAAERERERVQILEICRRFLSLQLSPDQFVSMRKQCDTGRELLGEDQGGSPQSSRRALVQLLFSQSRG